MTFLLCPRRPPASMSTDRPSQIPTRTAKRGPPVTRPDASGFTLVGEAGGGRWNRPGRPAADTHPIGKKLRWELAC
jgi:hypothetical protein